MSGRAPAAFGASLRSRLRNLARETGRPVGELEREYLLQRFLARVFADPEAGWILRGGTGLLARLPGGRHSQDIDLLHPQLTLPGPSRPWRPSRPPMAVTRSGSSWGRRGR